MGTLVPAGFPLASLRNEAEERVVRSFVERLSDDWVVLPHVVFSTHRDYELDVVLVHRDFGVLDVEVKGHRPRIRDGSWYSNGSWMDPQPPDQARTNAYALRGRLRSVLDLPHLDVPWCVALPAVDQMTGALPPDIRPEQLLLGPDLDDPGEAVEALLFSRTVTQPLTQADVEAIVGDLRPDADFSWDPLARAASARDRLDEICADQIHALAGLDENRRVAVTGAAGTGKTRLATTWAARAFSRGERTWLTCYNEPLAAEMRARLPEDESLVVGAFLTTALRLEGMPPFPSERPADISPDVWWNEHVVGHLLRHWPEITARFDTIVIDEAQDFSPAWITLLGRLLDPDGPRRLLLVADERQQLYRRGFSTPRADEGWTRAVLTSNCRSSQPIARLLRRRLDGAAAPAFRPSPFDVQWVRADDDEAAVAATEATLSRWVEEGGRASSLVITTGSELRDRLRDGLGLSRWEDRSDSTVACETVHRAKGLEVDSVLLVCSGDDVAEQLLYIGISRAVLELVVVAHPAIAERLGLDGR